MEILKSIIADKSSLKVSLREDPEMWAANTVFVAASLAYAQGPEALESIKDSPAYVGAYDPEMPELDAAVEAAARDGYESAKEAHESGQILIVPGGDHEGVYRRYDAGMMSLRGRAQLEVRVLQVIEVAAPSGYDDTDYILDLVVGDDEGGLPRFGRWVTARLSVSFHRTTGGAIRLGGDYAPSCGTVMVQSREKEESTTFLLRQEDLDRLISRSILEIALYGAIQAAAKN